MLLAPVFSAWMVLGAPPTAAPKNANALMEALANAGQPPAAIAAPPAPAVQGTGAPGSNETAAPIAPSGAMSSAPALAAEDPDGGVGGALRIASTAIVFALLIFGATMVVRRMKGVAPVLGANRALRVLESQWIGRGQRLVLVRVGAHRILLGTSQGGVRSLALLEGSGEGELGAASIRMPTRNEGSAFASIIRDEIGGTTSPALGVLDIDDLMPSRSERAAEKRTPSRGRREQEPDDSSSISQHGRAIGSPRFAAASREGLQDVIHRINGYVGAQRKAV